MEIAIIVILVVVILVLALLLSRAYKRQDKSIVMINDLISQEKKTQGLVRESQANFLRLVKLTNEENTNFYKQDGDWAHELDQAGLVYYIRKRDNQIEILIGLKGWDIDKCHDQGNVFSIPFHHQPKEIMRTLSGMFIRDAWEGYQRSLSKPLNGPVEVVKSNKKVG